MRFVSVYILLFYSMISVKVLFTALPGKQITDKGMMIDNCSFL